MKSILNKIQYIVLSIAVAVTVTTVYHYFPSTLVQKIKHDGELVVVTRNSPTTYYIGNDGPTGFEYELVKQFADYLGVHLRVVVKNEFYKILPEVVSGNAHIGAAGITRSKQRETYVDFSTNYHEIFAQVAYRGGKQKPKSIEDLASKRIAIVKGTSHAQMLADHKAYSPNLDWEEHPDTSSEELLNQVSEGSIDHTIVDSDELAINRRYFPILRVGFNLGPKQNLAWAFQKSEDESLKNAANNFLSKLETDGTLALLKEKYFGHVENITPADSHTFLKHVKKRLPKYENLFKLAAVEYNIDWRFIAAVSYQESLWKSNAVSPTGVRGLMMLTNDTANQLKINDRSDPVNSVLGGTQYFMEMQNKIPARITEPDRTWLALAAYNVGFGHLEDARILTQSAGDNPDLWLDVKKYLPLLSQEKWYNKTKFGYARGQEPVNYVQNIRNYLDLLVWLENKGKFSQLLAQNLQYH